MIRTVLALMIVLSTNLVAAVQVKIATVARIEGKAHVFTNPTDKPQGPGPFAKYEGKTYKVQPLILGQVVNLGDVVQTEANSKLRLIYANGDQLTLAPFSSLRISRSNQAKATSGEEWTLFFGSIRAAVSSEGPRKGTQVRARTAVMGVRGTDFFVTSPNKQGETEVSVLRGSVQMAQTAPSGASPSAARPVEVAAGFTASVSSVKKGVDKDREEIVNKPTPLSTLVTIQKDSVVKVDKNADLASPVQSELRSLESKAVAVVVADIKKHDPALYAQINSQKNLTNVDAIQSRTVKNFVNKARATRREKVDLNKDETVHSDEVYDKYFDVDEDI